MFDLANGVRVTVKAPTARFTVSQPSSTVTVLPVRGPAGPAGGGESGTGVTDHGALTGLGDDDHPRYALADGTRGAFASTTHNHDTRYYTESETDALLGGKANATHTHDYAATTHTHDDRYYTETEVDTALAGKVSTTDPRLSDARTPTAHDHDDRYYTDAEVDAALAAAVGGLDVAVEDYGAVGDGTTNDTAAIQAAIDAVIDAGGGRVRFADKTYLLSSALSTANLGYSQLTLKAPALADEQHRVRTLLLEGPRGKAAILKSTLTGLTYSATNGIPAVIGGPSQERVGDNTMRNLAVRARNLNIVVPNNPSLSGWNLELIAHASLEECAVWPVGNQGITMHASSTVLEPTNIQACGIILPGLSNYEQHWVKNCHVTGFFIGVMGAEHAVVDGYTSYRNVIALGLPMHQHLQSVRGLSVSWCRYAIATANPRVGLYSSAATYGAVTDAAAIVLNVDEFDYEDAVDSPGEWANATAHIYDPGNLIHGVIRGMRTQGGNLTTLDTDPFIVDGAANVEIINLVTNPEGSTPAGGFAVGSSRARAKRTADSATIGPNAGLTIPWNAEDHDTDSYHDAVTNNTRLTIPTAGVYQITAVLSFHSVSTTGVTYIVTSITKNGTQVAGGYASVSAEDENPSVFMQVPAEPCVAGDYFEATAYFAGCSGKVASGNNLAFTVVRLS